MRSPRAAAAVLLVFLLPGLAGSTVAAESDLERARRVYEEAKRLRDDANAGLDQAQARRDDLGTRLDAALSAYQETNHQMEEVGLTLASIRYEVDLTSDEVRDLDATARERAAQAYMRSVAGLAPSLMLTGSFEEAALLGATVGRATDADVAVFDDLERRRRDLQDVWDEYSVQQELLGVLRASLDLQRLNLEDLFAAASSEVLEAFETLADADADYEAALATLEEEERKRRWTGNVEQWRPLVASYFPPALVDEAMRVMACESGGNPDAKNRHSTATGLFQFLDGTWAWSSVLAGWKGYSRLDPEANIAVAAWLVDYSIRTGHPGGAWGHWECKP